MLGMNPVKRSLGIAFLVMAVSGCGRGEDDDIETRTPPPVDEEQLGNAFEPGDDWVLKQVFTTLVILPVLGPTELAAQSASYYTLKWVEEDGQYIQRETYCTSEFNEVAGMLTYLPDAFYEAIGVVDRRVILSEDIVGAQYLAPDQLSVYGAELDNPWSEALPSEPEDPRVVDFESDGHPGFTAAVDGWMGYAESYMTQRTVTTMTGTIISNDHIEGWIENTLEQHILDASSWWAGLDGFQSVPSGNPEENFFVLKAVEGGLSCEELLAQKDELF